MKCTLSLLASLAFALALVAPAASRQSDPSPPTSAPGPVFGIVPNPPMEEGYVLLDLGPGESATLEARVVTVDSIPLALRTYATNALSLVNGGFGAGLETDEVTAPASWLTFPPHAFNLESNDSLDIPFTVSVPVDTVPGQYIAALVAQTDGPLAIEGTIAFDQVIRSALPVVINVPGAWMVQFAVGVPELVSGTAYPHIVIPLTNTGTAFVRLEGELLVSAEDGALLVQAPVSMGSVYAGTATTIEVHLPSTFVIPGAMVVSGTLTDVNSGQQVVIESTMLMLAPPAEESPPVTFDVGPVTITPTGDPLLFVALSISIDNRGEAIPAGVVVLHVFRDDEVVEEYSLARNQAIPAGQSTIEQRYTPPTGWESGTYRFELSVLQVDALGVSTVILSVPLSETIVVP